MALYFFVFNLLLYLKALDYLIEVNRLCHKLLQEHLGSLADFDSIFVEANRQVSSSNGRITLHIFSELRGDLFPNYCFNMITRRFICGKVGPKLTDSFNGVNFRFNRENCRSASNHQ